MKRSERYRRQRAAAQVLFGREFGDIVDAKQRTIDALYRALRESGGLAVFLENANKASRHFRIVACIAQRNGDAPSNIENIRRRAVRVGKNLPERFLDHGSPLAVGKGAV